MSELSLVYEPCPAGGHVARNADGTLFTCAVSMEDLIAKIKTAVAAGLADGSPRPSVIKLRFAAHEVVIA